MNYPSIRIEGGILSPDILDRLENAQGQRPADFGLEPSVKVKDEIARAWADAQDYWRIFQRKLDSLTPNSPATTETRNHWIVPLLGLLGYQLEYQPRGTEVNEKNYPLSHRAANRARAAVHIIGYREPAGLDRKPERAPRMSAHAMVQEYLNLSDQLYGIVTNGRVLRLLRDSSRLIKLTYLEFDLDRIFSDGIFADFAVLFRLLHATRLPHTIESASTSWLERYHQETVEQGTRIRDGLRAAVTEALQVLGTGFLAHPDNADLRLQVSSGRLNPAAYFTHLLRLVYRLLFLMVIEDRGLIFPRGTPPKNIALYFQHYSIQRLRRLAITRGLKSERFHDAWMSLLSTFLLFENQEKAAVLGTTVLGGQLFNAESLGPLASSRLSNAALFTALDDLCYFTHPESGQRMPVNFGALATEEFGSVYESLLELHPIAEAAPAPHFGFLQAAGNERKTSGSYFTKSSLVECLLDSALDPVLNERILNFSHLGFKSVEEGILALKVCDSASGSGHFLIAAAHRIARRLATIRAGDEEPSPDQLRHALREVIGHCIYGVDINPMSVELCKVGLWLEAVEPGKPLNFLDHHIQCGNSLVGATPALLAKGIPDEAFTVIDGDDKAVCSEFKKQNKAERMARSADFFGHPWQRLGDLAAAMVQMEASPDDTIEAIHDRERRWSEIVGSTSYAYSHFWADAWCAAFVWQKTRELPFPITDAIFRDIERNPHSHLNDWLGNEVRRLAAQYRFFHWHLAFPEVFRIPDPKEQPGNEEMGWIGGFDLMLGNPPWDTLSPDIKEYFEVYDPQVRFCDKEEQERRVAVLLEDRVIHDRWEKHRRELYGLVLFIKESGRFRLFAPGNLGKGDFNVFRMFAETALALIRPRGWAALFVPDGLYAGSNCMAIRKELFERCRLELLLGFENAREVWFPGIDSRTKFCLYAAQRGGRTDSIKAAFNIRSEAELNEVQAGRLLSIPISLIKEFSPEALAIAEAANSYEIEIARKMYACWPKFGDETAPPPYRHYMCEVHMGNERELFSEDPNGFPVYEGRMVAQYDHRAKGYRSGRGRSAEWAELRFGKIDKTIQPQWFILKEKLPLKLQGRIDCYRGGFCDVASPTNERTLVAALLPPHRIAGHKVPTVTFAPDSTAAYILWLAVANSYPMDFLARKKVSLTMSYTIFDSLPFPRLAKIDAVIKEIAPRVLRLSCTGPEMIEFWNQASEEGFVPRWKNAVGVPGSCDEAERLQLRAEIEALVALHLYKLTHDELAYIIDTFPIVKRKDEQQHGEYRTKRMILEAYDQVQRAMEFGVPHQTILTSPAANPSMANALDTTKAIVVAPQSFPADEFECAICALFLDLLHTRPGLPLEDYKLAVACARNPEATRKIFTAAGRESEFSRNAGAIPPALASQSNQVFDWLAMRQMFEQNAAVNVEDPAGARRITEGPSFQAITAQYRLNVPGLSQVLLEAIGLIHDWDAKRLAGTQPPAALVQILEMLRAA